LIMQVAANMENPSILSVLHKPPVPEPGSGSAPVRKVADAGQSRAQAEQGGRAGPGRAGSRQPAGAGQGSGGAGGVLGGPDRVALQGATLSDTPVVQVGGPQGGPHQADKGPLFVPFPCDFILGLSLAL
jgi:hypothetical protein